MICAVEACDQSLASCCAGFNDVSMHLANFVLFSCIGHIWQRLYKEFQAACRTCFCYDIPDSRIQNPDVVFVICRMYELTIDYDYTIL